MLGVLRPNDLFLTPPTYPAKALVVKMLQLVHKNKKGGEALAHRPLVYLIPTLLDGSPGRGLLLR